MEVLLEDMMVNNRGQVGKFMTGFVAFIIIISIIGVYLAITTYISKNSASGDLRNNGFAEPSGFLFNRAVNETGVENMLLMDYLIDYLKTSGGNLGLDKIKEKLSYFVNADNPCLVFSSKVSEGENFVGKNIAEQTTYSLPQGGTVTSYRSGIFKYMYRNGKPVEMPEDFQDYIGRMKSVVLTISSDNQIKAYHVQYYLGKCLGRDA